MFDALLTEEPRDKAQLLATLKDVLAEMQLLDGWSSGTVGENWRQLQTKLSDEIKRLEGGHD